MNKKLLNDYCREILDSKQNIKEIIKCGSHISIEFEYDENYIYQENIIIHTLDVISFIYSKTISNN